MQLQSYHKTIKKRLLLIFLIIVCVVVSLIFDIFLGSTNFSISEIYQTLIYNSNDKALQLIVWQIRIPQALMAVLVGFALALSGAQMQTILNNPLASPFTLGVSSAAAFGAALAIVLQVNIFNIDNNWLITLNAFIFAMFSSLLLDFIARFMQASTSAIVLFGIVLVFAFNSAIAVLQFVASSDTLQGLVMWTMGSLNKANWQKVYILFIICIIIFSFAMKNCWQLTALTLGEDRAVSLGVNLEKLRLNTLLQVAILAAVCTSFVGPIGFIGLVAPHIARIIAGSDHRFYLPLSAILGALILSLSNILSKNLIQSIIIPIGIITSFIGIPFFMSIIFKNHKHI